ncbi:hypothetical protein ACFL45_02370 [Candidatus Neomarinimicrobiota bacterium]
MNHEQTCPLSWEDLRREMGISGDLQTKRLIDLSWDNIKHYFPA